MPLGPLGPTALNWASLRGTQVLHGPWRRLLAERHCVPDSELGTGNPEVKKTNLQCPVGKAQA